MDKLNDKAKASRREFVRKAVYVAPVILTLSAAPSFAKVGSAKMPPPGTLPIPPEVS